MSLTKLNSGIRLHEKEHGSYFTWATSYDEIQTGDGVTTWASLKDSQGQAFYIYRLTPNAITRLGLS